MVFFLISLLCACLDVIVISDDSDCDHDHEDQSRANDQSPSVPPVKPFEITRRSVFNAISPSKIDSRTIEIIMSVPKEGADPNHTSYFLHLEWMKSKDMDAPFSSVEAALAFVMVFVSTRHQHGERAFKYEMIIFVLEILPDFCLYSRYLESVNFFRDHNFGKHDWPTDPWIEEALNLIDTVDRDVFKGVTCLGVPVNLMNADSKSKEPSQSWKLAGFTQHVDGAVVNEDDSDDGDDVNVVKANAYRRTVNRAILSGRASAGVTPFYFCLRQGVKHEQKV